ncbi:MAG: hypothetical protein K6T65_15115 [Peptococcaceae bacterium]|nr:hypothetical protein [Peptococcaceae bacterium]
MVAVDPIIRQCINSGFFPNITFDTRFPETVFLLVEAELGIAMFPRYVAESYANNDLHLIELEEKWNVEFVVAWMKNNTNPTIPLFLKDIEDHFSS